MKNNYFKMIVIACLSTFLFGCHSEKNDKSHGHNKKNQVIPPGGHNDHPSGGPSSPNSSTSKEESFTYEFQLNGCSTAKHQFSSQEEMCISLQNDTLNNSCASDLRREHFQKFCPNQTYQPFKEDGAHNNKQQASPGERDQLKGDILVRTLYAGESSLVLFKNPTGESARTLVYCVESHQNATKLLSEPGMGGVIITKGTKIVMKNDTSAAFNDGSKLKGTYLQFNCQ